MASKTALMLRSLFRSHSSGLIFLEEGQFGCPPSVSLFEDIKFKALSMLSKALALSLCREVCFIDHFESKYR